MDQNIPLIIPNFNQLTYLRNLVNWFQWYAPESDIVVLDNGSDYGELMDYYDEVEFNHDSIHVISYPENDFVANLNEFLYGKVHPTKLDKVINSDHYIISDPDIMPHPATPMNFIDIFRHCIDTVGFHHVGFNLISDDLPDWLYKKAHIVYDESQLLTNPTEIYFNGVKYPGHVASLDTTFTMFKRSNGWSAPMSGEDWSSSLRLFRAFHLGWYIDGDRVNPEMDHYFKSSKYREIGGVSAGKNNNRPAQYVSEEDKN